jgi:hypothetical protein
MDIFEPISLGECECVRSSERATVSLRLDLALRRCQRRQLRADVRPPPALSSGSGRFSTIPPPARPCGSGKGLHASTPPRSRWLRPASSSDARRAGHVDTGHIAHIRADRYPASYHLSPCMCCTATATTPNYFSLHAILILPLPEVPSPYVPPHGYPWRNA